MHQKGQEVLSRQLLKCNICSVGVYVVNSKANKQAYGKPGLLKNDCLIKPKSLCTFHNKGFPVYLLMYSKYLQTSILGLVCSSSSFLLLYCHTVVRHCDGNWHLRIILCIQNIYKQAYLAQYVVHLVSFCCTVIPLYVTVMEIGTLE